MKKEQENKQHNAECQVSQEEYEALVAENEKLIGEVDKLTEEVEKVKKTCDRLQSSADKSDKYLGQLVAMKNDFESYKRRITVNTEQAKLQGTQEVAAKLIAICDNFELAQKHLEGDNLKAFVMIYNQFVQLLSEIGVEKLDVLGQQFDCKTMNALSKVDRGEENTDKVVEVFRCGYVMGDKVLRYADVIVGA